MHIAFIDHSFHKVTRSNSFFLDLLKGVGEVTCFFDETWCGGANGWKQDFNEKDFDLVVIWQVHEAFDALSGSHPNVVFVPMYDAMIDDNDEFYWRDAFGTARIVSFSRRLHEEVQKRGAISEYYRYFPDPSRYAIVPPSPDIKAFFWYRRTDLNLRLVSQLCGEQSLKKLAIHFNPDPGHEAIDLQYLPTKAQETTITRWFDTKQSYLEQVRRSNIFFAPRRTEGIGMSVLEAMACGCCVLAPDRPTMNEYISNGTNGLLYDIQDPRPLDFSWMLDIGARARETVERGYIDWTASAARLADYVVGKHMYYRFVPPLPSKAIERHVSVVTVCKNAARDLEKTMENIRDQIENAPSWLKVGHVVLDGASDDGSIDLLRAHNEHLTYWKSEGDDGVYHAMNKAVEHCDGEWVIFINAGDYFAGPNALARLFAGAPADAEIVYGHHLYQVPGEPAQYQPVADIRLTWQLLQSGELSPEWLARIPCHQATAVKRSLLLECPFDTSLTLAADHDWLFHACRAGRSFFNSDEIISVYMSGGMSAKNYDVCIKEWQTVALRHGKPFLVRRFYDELDTERIAAETNGAGPPDVESNQPDKFKRWAIEFYRRTFPVSVATEEWHYKELLRRLENLEGRLDSLN